MLRIFIQTLLLGLILLTTGLFGCNRKQQNPELVDPLYVELERQKKAAETDLKSAQEAQLEAESNMEKVKPQTGQIKYATKRLNEAKNRVIKAKQLVLYFALKIEARMWSAREEYLSSYYDKSPWPNPEPLEVFKLNQRLSLSERDWSSKKRREALGFKVQDIQKDTQPRDPADTTKGSK